MDHNCTLQDIYVKAEQAFDCRLQVYYHSSQVKAVGPLHPHYPMSQLLADGSRDGQMVVDDHFINRPFRSVIRHGRTHQSFA